MAQGKICPKCQYFMYALIEEQQARGCWVYYECRNEHCKFREVVYEESELSYHPVETDNIINNIWNLLRKKF